MTKLPFNQLYFLRDFLQHQRKEEGYFLDKRNEGKIEIHKKRSTIKGREVKAEEFNTKRIEKG